MTPFDDRHRKGNLLRTEVFRKATAPSFSVKVASLQGASKSTIRYIKKLANTFMNQKLGRMLRVQVLRHLHTHGASTGSVYLLKYLRVVHGYKQQGEVESALDRFSSESLQVTSTIWYPFTVMHFYSNLCNNPTNYLLEHM